MIKDEIKNPSRLGITDAIFAGENYDEALGLAKCWDDAIRLTMSKNAADNFLNDEVLAMLIDSNQAHALGKALIELSGIEEEPAEDKPLHISLEEYGELREGDQVILRNDTSSDEVFKFGYIPRFRYSIKSGTPVTVKQIDTNDDSVRVVNSDGLGGWFTYQAVKEVASKTPRHISKEGFDSIEAGDRVVIRKDLAVGEHYGGVYFNATMRQWATDGVPLKVMPTRSFDGDITAENPAEDDWYVYSKEMIQEVIKAPKEHFRVRLSTKIWYAGKGGQITLDKDSAAIMNKPHAENVVKKYGGQLIKVDYSELEDK